MKNFTLKRRLLALLVCALAWINVGAEEIVYTNTNDNYKIIKVSDNEYRVETVDASRSANFQNMPGNNDFSGVDAFKACTGKITISGKFSSIQALNNNSTKFTDVNMKNLQLLDWQGNPTNIDMLKNYFKDVTSLVMPDSQTSIGSFFNDISKIQNLTIGAGITEIPYQTFVNKTTLKSVTFAEGVEEIGQEAFQGCTNLTSVTFPSSLTEIGQGAFQRSGLTSVTIPNSVTTIGQDAFDNTPLASVTFQPESSVTKLATGVFGSTKITNVEIPASVTEIENEAFRNCDNLTTVVFADRTQPIRIDGNEGEQGGAFHNCRSISDVWINISDPDITIDSEIDAFASYITYGQGDGERKMATLHFPAANASHYTNMNHVLTVDIASDTGKFHDWLMKHVQMATGENPANGWWQFVNAGTNDEENDIPITNGKFLKTFSDNEFARIVPRGMKAYAVSGIAKEVKNGKNYYNLTLTILDVIPRNTGVILFGEPNAHSMDGTSMTVTMSVVVLAEKDKTKGTYDAENHRFDMSDSGEEINIPDGTDVYDASGNFVRTVDLSLRRKNWTQLEAHHVATLRNYLEPSTLAGEASTNLQPYKEVEETDEEGNTKKVAYRYFGFSHYRKSATGIKDESTHGKPTKEDYDFAGFFRCKKSSIGPGKAYLKLAATEYDDPEGGEAIILESNNLHWNEEYYSGGEGASGSWKTTDAYWTVANWYDKDMFGKRDDDHEPAHAKFAGEVEFDEFEDGTATLILPASMVDVEKDESFYTLQGIKVANPSKGIYIKNGKKVVIK